MKPNLSLSALRRYSELNKQLTITVKFISDLENENREAMKKFHDGYYNQHANFKEAKEVIKTMKERRKEIKKSEKICEKIRKELKDFE